jgi:antitoxin HigA-1
MLLPAILRVKTVFHTDEIKFRANFAEDYYEDRAPIMPMMPMKNPPHPGDFIRTEIIQPAGLSVTAAAAALKVSRPALSSLLNGKASLSGDMALRIEKAFGVTMDTLVRMQSAYDIARTRLRERHIRVRRIPNTSGT